MATKLVTNILRVVGEAKSADDEARRLPSSAAPMVITGPRKEVPDTKKSDMDNEIPF